MWPSGGSGLMGREPTSVLYELLFSNGKRYWGMTEATARKRCQDHFKNARNGSRFPVHCAIRKYGIENVKVFTRVVGSLSYIRLMEIEAISVYKTQDRRYGYNVTFGGDISPSKTPSVAAAISTSCKGRIPGNKGKRYNFKRLNPSPPLSEEHKRKVGDSVRGRGWANNGSVERRLKSGEPIPENWMSGRVKFGKPSWNHGIPMTDEAKAKASAKLLGVSKPSIQGKPAPWTSESNRRVPRVKGLIWITNGISNRRIKDISQLEYGWEIGCTQVRRRG